jgi:hypothetical protein
MSTESKNDSDGAGGALVKQTIRRLERFRELLERKAPTQIIEHERVLLRTSIQLMSPEDLLAVVQEYPVYTSDAMGFRMLD